MPKKADLRTGSVTRPVLSPAQRKIGGRQYTSIVNQAEPNSGELGRIISVQNKDMLSRVSALSTGLTKIIKNAVNNLKRDTRNHLLFCDLVIPVYSNSAATIVPYRIPGIHSGQQDLTNYRIYSLKTGAYHVEAAFSLQAISASSGFFAGCQLDLHKNGAYFATLSYDPHTNSTRFFLNGSIIVYLECGDYIDVWFSHTNTYDNLRDTNCKAQYGYFAAHYSGCNCTDTGVAVPVF